MDDLIASLSGTMHVSQESYELENFKAHLARTLVVPLPQPSASLKDGCARARNPSLTLNFSFDSMPIAQPLPSPASNISDYSSFPFEEPREPVPAYAPVSPAPAYEDDAALQAAFAGDAFAPLWAEQAAAQANAKAAADPWGVFREKQAGAWPQQQFGGFVTVEPASTQQPAPEYQYAEYADYDEDERMDEDMADDMLAVDDEEQAVNEGYYARSW